MFRLDRVGSGLHCILLWCVLRLWYGTQCISPAHGSSLGLHRLPETWLNSLMRFLPHQRCLQRIPSHSNLDGSRWPLFLRTLVPMKATIGSPMHVCDSFTLGTLRSSKPRSQPEQSTVGGLNQNQRAGSFSSVSTPSVQMGRPLCGRCDVIV